MPVGIKGGSMAEIDKIPDYQTLMLPVLKIAGDGKEHRISEGRINTE
jgi:hypothetical protein